MNDQPIENAINAIGAVTEIAGFLLEQLTANGFSRDEAFHICNEFVIRTMLPQIEVEEDE